jgi:hypothetical protein
MAQAEYVTNSIRAPIPGVIGNPCTALVGAAQAKFVAVLVGYPPQSIHLDSIVLEDRADHLNIVLGAFSIYISVILEDTARNVLGGPNLPSVDAVLADLAPEVTGATQQAADGMAGRVA